MNITVDWYFNIIVLLFSNSYHRIITSSFDSNCLNLFFGNENAFYLWFVNLQYKNLSCKAYEIVIRILAHYHVNCLSLFIKVSLLNAFESVNLPNTEYSFVGDVVKKLIIFGEEHTDYSFTVINIQDWCAGCDLAKSWFFKEELVNRTEYSA